VKRSDLPDLAARRPASLFPITQFVQQVGGHAAEGFGELDGENALPNFHVPNLAAQHPPVL